LQTTIQSRPRTGLRHLGVPSSGAADPLSLALANRLVGNRWDAPALEVTLLGPTLQFEGPCAFGIAGAEAGIHLNDETVSTHETIHAQAGDRLTIGAMTKGARLYIAFAGGLSADELLGSASTYLPGGFGGCGGRALEEGDRLTALKAAVDPVVTPEQFRLPVTSSRALRSCMSFETHQLDDRSAEYLFDSNWTVGRRADRMGLQLDGRTLQINSEGRMPSAGVFPGTIQCTENGTPFMLSVDAGTVGGYPRIAQVARLDRHVIGQLKPGDHVRLLQRDADDAAAELRAKTDYWRRWLPDIDAIL
jgi:biotin-dependent carboxylase-like uncharacterized protein